MASWRWLKKKLTRMQDRLCNLRSIKDRKEEIEELEELKKDKNRVDCGVCDATRGAQHDEECNSDISYAVIPQYLRSKLQ